ncbi:phage replisome organizer N-terminal domain-containing protein [Liquorilactobacillus mali]|uniref:phage replisome organizer N-terminal domain-containing protein n=1 Tax=Liquorilactobacillus mali TaxID=1618 RepID=UPI002954A1B9|nr:phage replisome organizer N-terminal domain-containing protein [Liquorilactobacillus mali]MDV7758238.1 replication protein [Liquorilactobacillus mali]
MADNKKYYYLKLKDNFFESDEILVLESMQDGYKYENILLKLYLRSLKHQGKLMFKDAIPFNSQMLATVTRHSVGDIEKAVKTFKQLGLIDVMDNGAIYISDIQEFIGKSSTEADRKKEYRKRIEKEKLKKTIDSGQMSGQTSDKRTPEIDIDIEKEIDIDIKKQVRHKYGRYKNVLLNDKQLDKLKDEFPSDYQTRIENVSEYCQSHGKTYKDYLATIRNWARREKKKSNSFAGATDEKAYDDMPF